MAPTLRRFAVLRRVESRERLKLSNPAVLPRRASGHFWRAPNTPGGLWRNHIAVICSHIVINPHPQDSVNISRGSEASRIEDEGGGHILAAAFRLGREGQDLPHLGWGVLGLMVNPTTSECLHPKAFLKPSSPQRYVAKFWRMFLPA